MTPSTPVPGLANAYLGVGLDVFGNFANGALATAGCHENPLDHPLKESVTVRGPGNNTDGYCLLGTKPAGQLDSGVTPTAVPVEVAVNPTNHDLTAAGGFTVAAGSWAVQVTPLNNPTVQESGPLPSASGLAPDSWLDGNGVPLQFSFGWAASTGEETDYHTISTANVQTLNGTPPALSVALTDNSGGTAQDGATVAYTAQAAVESGRVAHDHLVRHLPRRTHAAVR